ncbi:hypothetical protein EV586_101509 [Tumebacillus sp. BK434]|uniref:hypothetical protein n=1 Tax=Tumebacillus sp. BK434 TaxID=2512169 RepID=UPI0010503B6C|nr:hypothetical protein [Tumebacillus sp. BK434]TCP59293.1 hypothetical protein EV586_101509 [Tumebacillus sp. BK434]
MANPNPTLNFFKGMGWVLLGHLLIGIIASVAPPLLLLIGVTQLLYVIPLIIWARRDPQRVGTIPGVLTMAGITFLLNAACWGLLWGLFMGAH